MNTLLEQLWMDPDWTCPQCGFVNIAVRSQCRNFTCGFRWEDDAMALVINDDGKAEPWKPSSGPGRSKT